MKRARGVARRAVGACERNGTWAVAPVAGYCHQALHYHGTDDLVRSLVPFVESAEALGEPVLVMLDDAALGALAGALDPVADEVEMVDVADVGLNPARVLPTWCDFIERHRGSRLRVVGEPLRLSLGDDVLAECLFNEDLLNVAFDRSQPLWLLCPYDTTALSASVVRGSLERHPFVYDAGGHRASGAFAGRGARTPTTAVPLSRPPPDARCTRIEEEADLPALRHWLRTNSTELGGGGRADDVVLAGGEVATNSLSHGGGAAEIAMWTEPGTLRCEVSDTGSWEDPLAGRRAPPSDATAGRGLWIANQLSDLVQIRPGLSGTVVRLTWRIAGPLASPARPA